MVFSNLLLSLDIMFLRFTHVTMHIASCSPSIFTAVYLTMSIFNNFPTLSLVNGYLDYREFCWYVHVCLLGHKRQVFLEYIPRRIAHS